MQYFDRLLLLFAVLLLAYALPWVNSPASGLSLGAYDLAEWASLHPAVREQQPALFTSLLLRLPLVCLAVVIGFSAPMPVFHSVRWWVALVAVGMFALASLPPLEFLTEARDDVNYRQQFLLAIIAGVGGLVGLSEWLHRWRVYIAGGALALGLVSGVIGFSQGYGYLSGYEVPVRVGIGGLLSGLLLVIALLDLWYTRRTPTKDALLYL